MKIYDYTDEIAEHYTEGFARSQPLRWLVIHGTGGGGLLPWVRTAYLRPNSAQFRNYRNGIALFHYGIERRGTVSRFIRDDRWVYHASIGQLEHGTIGVENENLSRDNSGPYTIEQYQSLATLCAFLFREHATLCEIVSHLYCQQYISGLPKTKPCPGAGFDWRHFISELGHYFDRDAIKFEHGRIVGLYLQGAP